MSAESTTACDREALELLARSVASRHQLYPELVLAIIEQESGFNPWAIRYEHGFFQRYILPQWVNSKLPSITEAQARAFSWGVMQVMGQVAREHGFEGAFLAELCDPAIGLEVGCRVLAAKLAAADGNVTKALLLWNGGSNAAYPEQVLARAEKYKSPAGQSVSPVLHDSAP